MKFKKIVTLLLIGACTYFSKNSEIYAESHLTKEEILQSDINKFFGNISADLNSLHFFEGTFDERETRTHQLMAEQYTNLVLIAEISNRQFIQCLFDPLRTILTANPCKSCVPCSFLQNYETWISFSGGKGFIHENGRKNGLRLSDYEIAGGIQGTFYTRWTLGAALSYEHDNITYKLGGSGLNNTLLGGFYGLYRGKSFYGMFDVTMGHSNDRIRRKIDLDGTHYKPHANVKVHQRSIYGELGTDFAIDATLIQPFVGIEWGHYSYGRFSESGGSPFAVNIRKNSLSNAYSYLGVHLTSPPLRCGFAMNIDLAWRYQLKGLSNNIFVEFQQFNDSFKVKPFSLNRNSYEGSVRVSKSLFKSWELFFDATCQGWSNSTIYKFLGGVKTTW